MNISQVGLKTKCLSYLNNSWKILIKKTMNEYKALVSIMAECESDFKEQLDALDCYELEWFSENDSSCCDCVCEDCGALPGRPCLC